MKKRIYLTLSELKLKDSDRVFHVDNRVGGNDYLHWICEFEKKDYEIYFVNWDDYSDGQFSRVYSYNLNSFVESKPLTKKDAIFLYKQEGFVMPENVSRFHEMLDELEQTGAFIVNHPKTIRWNISKEHVYYLMEKGANVRPVYEIKDVLDRAEAGENFVVKPKIASRGNGLVVVRSKEDVEKLKNLPNSHEFIAQEFCSNIRDGEKSLFFVGLDYSHGVLKVPNPTNPDEIRCNKSTGGIVTKYDPTKEEIEYAKALLELIQEEYPVIYSRIDFAYHDGKPSLIEAELLNPSAFAIFAGVGEEFAEKFVSHLDKLIEEHLK